MVQQEENPENQNKQHQWGSMFRATDSILIDDRDNLEKDESEIM